MGHRGRSRRPATSTRSARTSTSCASATPSVGGPRTVTLDDIDHFAEFTGDTFYAHTDPEAAAANPLFGGIVAHGYLVVSLAAGLFVDPDPGPVLANFGVDNLRFLTPVKAEDTIDGHADGQADHAAQQRRLRRGALGRRRRQRGGRARRDVRRTHTRREDAAMTSEEPHAPHHHPVRHARRRRAFDAHYAADPRTPRPRRCRGCADSFGRIPAACGSDAPYFVAELWFDDADALKAALKSPEMAATAADAQTFDVAAMTMFSQTRWSKTKRHLGDLADRELAVDHPGAGR